MFTLTIEDSNNQIADRFSFDHGSYVVGRLDSCDIVLPSSSVSREHARVFIEHERCYIEDLGSANGVIVDGQRVLQRRDLGTASQIRIGDFYLYLEFQAQPTQGRQSVLNTLFISNDSDHHKLVRVNDSFAGEEFGLSEVENTIGRTDENFILLADSSISRRHAKIVRHQTTYHLHDLGSSNGTRLNGDRVDGATPLEGGDLVEFGDIEFVFTEGGLQVDVDDYSPQKSSTNKAAVFGGLAVLVLFGLALGALIVYALFWFKQTPHPHQAQTAAATTSVQDQATQLLTRGKAQMRRRQWPKAASTFDEVLALAPGNAQASSLRKQAHREQKGAALLRQGEELSEQGRHGQARDVLTTIPDDTVAYRQAQPTLEHVEKTMAYNLKNEVIRLMKHDRLTKRQLRDAHRKLSRSLSLGSDDPGSSELMDRLESRMTKQHVALQPDTDR